MQTSGKPVRVRPERLWSELTMNVWSSPRRAFGGGSRKGGRAHQHRGKAGTMHAPPRRRCRTRKRNPFCFKRLRITKNGRGAGIRTRDENRGDSHTSPTSYCKTQTSQCVTTDGNLTEKHPTALPKHPADTSLHEKCAIYVPRDFEDLAQVVEAWCELPEKTKKRILALMNAEANRDEGKE